MKYAIVGFQKCGTVSLEAYLKGRFGKDNVIRIVPELTWMKGGSIQFYKKYRHDYRPVIITRNYQEMLKSAYNYYPEFRSWKYDTFMRAPPWKSYDDEIKAFETFHPIVLSLEEMKKNPNFPHMNKSTYPS